MRHFTFELLRLCLLLTAPLSASAVVHTTGDGSGNTTPPPDDPGFANVGSTLDPSGLSGVYLGNRWVLTAGHVGEPSFVFDGVTYAPVPGSRQVIDYPLRCPTDWITVLTSRSRRTRPTLTSRHRLHSPTRPVWGLVKKRS